MEQHPHKPIKLYRHQENAQELCDTQDQLGQRDDGAEYPLPPNPSQPNQPSANPRPHARQICKNNETLLHQRQKIRTVIIPRQKKINLQATPPHITILTAPTFSNDIYPNMRLRALTADTGATGGPPCNVSHPKTSTLRLSLKF